MKCDKLKEYKAYEYGTSYVYDIGEVKEAIAELKAKLEDVKASMYADMVNAGMRERRLRRALWLTRANMARGLAEMCEHQFDCCGVSRSRFLVGYDKKSKPKRMTTTEWGELWRKIEQKCRTKAEEYK